MKSLAIAAAMTLLGLAACQTAAPYEPLNPGATHAAGYSEIRLQPDRWRVTYLGDRSTSREAVESGLLRRAAELTLAQGYDSFSAADREDSRSRIPTALEDQPEGWQPNWRYFGRGFGWRDWDPTRQDPLWAEHVSARVITRYEASEEIVMRHGDEPAGAVDARKVLRRLTSGDGS